MAERRPAGSARPAAAPCARHPRQDETFAGLGHRRQAATAVALLGRVRSPQGSLQVCLCGRGFLWRRAPPVATGAVSVSSG